MTAPEGDAELLSRLRDRDSTAFELLYDRYHRLVYGIALRMLGDAATAEDVTQSVFVSLWRSPEEFRGGGRFGAWLSRVARNRSLDILRARSQGQTEISADVPVEESVENEVFAKLDADRVRSALAMLPDEQRVLIETGFFGGVTHEEMAKLNGIPLGTIKTHIRTGLRRLYNELQR